MDIEELKSLFFYVSILENNTLNSSQKSCIFVLQKIPSYTLTSSLRVWDKKYIYATEQQVSVCIIILNLFKDLMKFHASTHINIIFA